MDLVKRGTLDDWELARRRAELNRLEVELAEREQRLTEYKAALAAFAHRYHTALARPHALLDELEAVAAEKAAKLDPEDGTKRRKAERLRGAADVSAGLVRPPREEAAAKPQAPDDVKKLYRDLTKRIHPDHADDETDREHREALMRQANAAYAERDLETLAYLMGHWALGLDAAAADTPSVLERVMRQIAQTAERLTRPAEELAAAERSELGQLMRRAVHAEAHGRDFLAKLVADVEEAQRDRRKRIKTLDRRLAKQVES